MYPIWHLISSVILAILLFPFFGWQVLWVLIGGVFTDIDHYFVYVVKFKGYSLIRTYDYFESTKRKLDKGSKKKFKSTLCIFHTIEFIVLMAFLSFYFKFVFLIFVGLVLHLGMELIEAIEKRRWKRVISFFVWLKNPNFKF